MTSSRAFLTSTSFPFSKVSTINVLFSRRGVGVNLDGLVRFDFICFSHPGRGTNSRGARAPYDRAVTSFDDLACGHIGWICHDEHELHTLWSVAQDQSRNRIMLVSLRAGPILPITIELNHHQVILRDHRCSPQRDRTHGNRCWHSF